MIKGRVIFTVILFILIISLTAACSDDENAGEFDIESARIGVMTGTTGEKYATEAYPDATISSFGSIMEAIAALQTRRLDAVVTSDVMGRTIERENPGFIMLPEPLTHEYICAGVKKGNDGLLEDINRIIIKFREDGTLDDLAQRWVYSYPPVPAEIPGVSEGEVLRVANAAVNVPFVYADSSGNTIGFAPELAYRIGLEMGRPVEFLTVEFAALIPALESDKVDCIIDIMAATEERKQAINFSEHYYVSGQILLMRRESLSEEALAALDSSQTTHSGSPSVEESGFWESIKTGFQRNLIHESRWKLIVEGLKISLIITVFAFALATIGGFGICALKMSKNKLFNAIGSIYITILRGTPVVVLLMITFYIIFARSSISGTIVAIIAFGANGAAFIGEIIRSAIQTIDKGQVEAARSMGFSKSGAFLTVTFPQAVRIAFSTYMSEFVSMFKMTSIVGYIAIVDLTKAGDIIRSRTYDAFFPLIMVAVVYLITATIMIWLFTFINRKTNKRLSRHRRAKS